jgi:acetyl-CoA carboxylase biotin carboxyl carrier protein
MPKHADAPADSTRDLTVDSELVRTLAALLAETGLSEIEYAVGERRIRVARSLAAAAPAVTAPPPAAAANGAAPAAEPSFAAHAGAVKAPMVGTVYLSPQPEAPPFAKLGDVVAAGQPLLIIEAMKVMNQIRAPRAGRLTQILVEDGAPVEYGEVVMVVE